MSRLLLLLTALYSSASAEFGLAGQLFQLSGASSVNNAKLAWDAASGGSTYRVEQSIGGGEYQTIATVTGNTHDDYDLGVGSEYKYRITALDGTSEVDVSSIATLSPFTPQGSYETFDNTKASQLLLLTELEDNGVYYRYNYERFDNGSFSQYVEQTSSDGFTWSGDKVVLTSEELCAPANYSCKLERENWKKHPETGEFVLWAHYERSQDYGLGWVATAHAKPGENLTFGGAFRPLGDDSRDMTFFADGNDAWIVGSTNTNSDMNIYSLTSNWTAVDQFVVQVNKGQHREAPSMLKSNGWYYLFTSRAAGWLPSQAQYIASQSMAGPWSDGKNVANIATFAAQSGNANPLPSGQFAMTVDRWSANWPTKGGNNRQLLAPISLAADSGFAAYHFYRTVQYSREVTTAGQGAYGVQTGKILSIGKTSSSDAGSENIALANDGIQDTPGKFFKPSKVPFSFQIDLEKAHAITEVDLTTNMVQGSETFYKFKVAGSTDNTTWTDIADKSSNTDPGFVAAFPTDSEAYRYIRVDVASVVNNVNGNEADFAVGVSEMTVYGV